MKKDLRLQIQEDIFEQFKEVDNETLCKVIKSFVYMKPTDDENISKMVTKFLEDNDLAIIYGNIYMDHQDYLNNIQRSFLRTTISERSMFDDIQIAFWNLSFNRLNNLY